MSTDAPTLYLGAYAVRVRDGRILLARLRPDDPIQPGYWTLPGGGVEFGEPPDDAVLRELKEETGLTGRRGEVLGIFSRHYRRTPQRPRPPAHFVGILYRVDSEPGELVDEADGSTDCCAWVALADAAALPLVDVAAHAVKLSARIV